MDDASLIHPTDAAYALNFNIPKIRELVHEMDIDASVRFQRLDEKGRHQGISVDSLVASLNNYIRKSSVPEILTGTPSSDPTESSIYHFFRLLMPTGGYPTARPPQHDLTNYPTLVTQAGFLDSMDENS